MGIEFIAETSWHHEGEFDFLNNLVQKIIVETNVGILKFHISLNPYEYLQERFS